ncbi:unnamed protein product [Amoebophrya sp. A120]|nr:unnamed protein product [Amoebophrya sp. A120]|eukprot:GSA120T00003203001.1
MVDPGAALLVNGGVPSGTFDQIQVKTKAEADKIMCPKANGTTDAPPPYVGQLRWNCDQAEANQICCFNRHYAEHSGYWERKTKFFAEEDAKIRTELKLSGEGNLPEQHQVTFYDTITSKPLFRAPRGRSWNAFILESRQHGWPSFRDEEVLTGHVRILPGGEAVSTAGTHLGHNIPDKKGNRYCINLVSVCGHGPARRRSRASEDGQDGGDNGPGGGGGGSRINSSKALGLGADLKGALGKNKQT